MSTEAKDHDVYADTIRDKCEIGAPDPEFDPGGRVSWTVTEGGERRPAPLDEALMLSSANVGRPGAHRPVIDIDIPIRLVPSTTKGHHHLYVDHDVEWGEYLALLRAMVAAGIVEEGYVNAAEARQATFVRLPWVKKCEPKEANA